MSTKKSILVTGSNGQLGKEIFFISKNYPEYNFIFTNRQSLSISNEAAVVNFFKTHQIDLCINCAAYTAVDKAETDKDEAIQANATAVSYLAQACHKANALLIHISTDYVFDGTSNIPYEPNMPTCPINFYGQTKLQGEQLAIQQNPNTIIIRTAWVYSSQGNNFVKTMLRLMADKPSLGVVNDQFGAPTYAVDLANAIMQIIGSKNIVPGIYHYCNKGNISWYDFANEIATFIKTTCIVNPIATSQFPTPAKRPAYSVLSTNKIETNYNIPTNDWKTSLHLCLKIISSNK
jgi:dTDP-4-dehydrorhamnose reductase